jgi:hypothetical protein
MRNPIKTVGMNATGKNFAIKTSVFVILLTGSAFAQRLVSGPTPAVSGPSFDVSAGYSHLTMAIPSAGHVNLEGLDAGASIAFDSRWGAMVDTQYLRTANVLTTPHQGYILSFQAGPKFYLFERRNTRAFIDALAGAALVDGAVPVTPTSYFHGWLGRPAYSFGGGVEQSLMGPLAVRFTGEYLRTTFYDPGGAAQPQNNLRLTASFVFRLKEHRHFSGYRQ